LKQQFGAQILYFNCTDSWWNVGLLLGCRN